MKWCKLLLCYCAVDDVADDESRYQGLVAALCIFPTSISISTQPVGLYLQLRRRTDMSSLHTITATAHLAHGANTSHCSLFTKHDRYG